MATDLIFIASAVSQATFALTLCLLAWTDRRSRGLLWLAAGSALHLLATLSMKIWAAHPLPPLGVAGMCALVLLFFCEFEGVQQLLSAGRDSLRRDAVLLAANLVLVLALYGVNKPLCLATGRTMAIAWLAATAWLLFRTRTETLRRVARVSGTMVTALLLCMVLRLLITLHLLPGQGQFDLGMQLSVLAASWLSVLSFIALYMAAVQHRMYVETRLDALTGLHNRRSMEELVEREIRAAQHRDSPLALLMVDADHFKQLNDTWGHSLGDRALRELAAVLERTVGSQGFVARMGGEEFAVLLRHVSEEQAAELGERLRFTIEGLRLIEGGGRGLLTVSIGVAMLRTGETSWTEMLRRADIALYRAKREGRNRVTVAGSGEVMWISHGPLAEQAAAERRARWMRGYSVLALGEKTTQAVTSGATAGSGGAVGVGVVQGPAQEAPGGLEPRLGHLAGD